MHIYFHVFFFFFYLQNQLLALVVAFFLVAVASLTSRRRPCFSSPWLVVALQLLTVFHGRCRGRVHDGYDRTAPLSVVSNVIALSPVPSTSMEGLGALS